MKAEKKINKKIGLQNHNRFMKVSGKGKYVIHNKIGVRAQESNEVGRDKLASFLRGRHLRREGRGAQSKAGEDRHKEAKSCRVKSKHRSDYRGG